MIFLVFDKINSVKASFVLPDGGEIKPIRYNIEDTIYYLQTELKTAIITHDTTIIYTEENLSMPASWPPAE